MFSTPGGAPGVGPSGLSCLPVKSELAGSSLAWAFGFQRTIASFNQ